MADPERKMKKTKQPSLVKKAAYWIVAILIFYLFTAATVSQGTVEVEKTIEQRYTVQEPIVVEKTVKTTKYKTDKVPFGTPRCEQRNYNYSYVYSYSEQFVDSKKVGTCTFDVTNQEDMEGTFTFYVQFSKNGMVSDGPDQTKKIGPFESVKFSWSTAVEPTDSISCLMYSESLPTRMKCFYLEPITYQIKQVPYIVEELKNVTEFVTMNKSKTIVTKENVTQDVYTNKYFGYSQFFYFGY